MKDHDLLLALEAVLTGMENILKLAKAFILLAMLGVVIVVGTVVWMLRNGNV